MKIGVDDQNKVTKTYYRCLLTFLILNLLQMSTAENNLLTSSSFRFDNSYHFIYSQI